MRQLDTIIVGGGISGLSCGRMLAQAGVSFKLVTTRLGGRMSAPGNLLWNLGASYINSDYLWVKKFVGQREPIRRRDVLFLDGENCRSIYHWRNARRWPGLLRLAGKLMLFRRQLRSFRKHCETKSQCEALRSDPLLTSYVETPAREFIAKHRLAEVDRLFGNPIVNSTAFVESTELSAFHYLDALLPIVTPTYVADLRGAVDALTSGWSDRILQDEVTEINRLDHHLFRVSTANEAFYSQRVVVGLPPSIAASVCREWPEYDTAGVRELSKYALFVRGERKPEFYPGKIIFLPAGHETTVFFHNQFTNGDVLFTNSEAPDLTRFYKRYRIVASVRWSPAIVLSSSVWRPLEIAPGLFAVGDRNICGLEDSFLTGMQAARRIIGTGSLLPEPVASST